MFGHHYLEMRCSADDQVLRRHRLNPMPHGDIVRPDQDRRSGESRLRVIVPEVTRDRLYLEPAGE